MKFADVHTHVLYNIDDGSKSLDMSKRMLDIAKKSGTQMLFVTPHCVKDNRDMDSINDRLRSLRELDSGVEIYLGCELLYSESGVKAVLQGKLPTLAKSRYLLTEFYEKVTEREMFLALSDIISHGLLPIIAHIERYPALKIQDIEQFCDMGAYVQVNASGVTAGFFKNRHVMSLLTNGLVHFVASDAHSDTHRPPVLSEAYKYLEKKLDSEYLDEIFLNNALKVVKDSNI